MAAFYFAAGALHLAHPERFLPIMPGSVPYPRAVVLATGVCEIAGALALMVPRLRRLAGVMLALYAIAVFPANLKHAFAGVRVEGLPDSWIYHGPRLAMQPVLVWWALFCSGVIDWSFSLRHKKAPST
nr:DoxX family protein [Methylocella silvestris]